MSELVRTPEEVIHYRTTYILGQMIRNGFTTVRDTGLFPSPPNVCASSRLTFSSFHLNQAERPDPWHKRSPKT